MANADYKERARKRAAERETSFWFKLKEGDNTFRILKTPESDTTPEVFFEYNIHRDVGPKKKMVRCGITAEGTGKCWLCTKIEKLSAAGKGARAARLAPQLVMILQVAKVDADGKFTGPFGFTPSKGVGDQILSSVLGSKKRDYADHKTGRNITLNRKGTGKNDTKYGMIEVDEDSSAVDVKLVKALKPFSELKEIGVYDEAAQKAAYEGRDVVDDDEDEEEDADATEGEDTEEDTDEDDEEEEEAPKVKKKNKPAVTKKKKTSEPDEDDDEEDDDTDVDEDDEDEDSDSDVDEEEDAPPPKKKNTPEPPAKKGKKKPEPEEDEEDDDIDVDEDDEDDIDLDADEDDTDADTDEDDEEEEEAPKAKKKSAPPPPPAKKKKK